MTKQSVLRILDIGDTLVIGGGMRREVVSVQVSAQASGIVVRDTTTKRCERIRADQLIKYFDTGWVRVEQKRTS